MKGRNWLLIALAFSAFLLIICLSAINVVSKTQDAYARVQRTERDLDERARLLADLRAGINALSVSVRDWLYAPAWSMAASGPQRELTSTRAWINANLDLLDKAEDAQERQSALLLRQHLDRYWQIVQETFRWSEAQRIAMGRELQREQLTPVREAIRDSTRDLERLEDRLREKRRGEMEGIFSTLKADFRRILQIALALWIVIAGWTVWRFSRLERKARRLQAQAEQGRQDLRDLSQQLVSAQEEERRTISRELHDQIGQLLTAIQMTFSNIEAARADVSHHIEDGKALTERTVTAVRDLAMGLRPSILDDLGLAPALEWQAREFTKRSGIAVELRHDGFLDDLPETHRTCLYRVIQEALTNCARHSGAKGARISLHGARERISLTVEDDGRGFQRDQLKRLGLGLLGMEERVMDLDGQISILSGEGKGTLIKVELPLVQEASA
jgi:signal transduction histidine kinase